MTLIREGKGTLSLLSMSVASSMAPDTALRAPPAGVPLLSHAPPSFEKRSQEPEGSTALPAAMRCRMTHRPKGNAMERKEVTRMLVGVRPQGQGTIRVVGAKLHGIVVTESKLNYHGSITIDTDILEAASLLPLEYVYIWNKHSGSRIETYVLPGPRGSGVVCLNGAAARTCQVGDEIIVASSREIPVSDYHEGFSCRVLTFDQNGGLPNRVAEKLEYRVAAKDDGTEFVIMDMGTGQEWIG